MKFEVFCDESGLEALKNKAAHQYFAIGGIWIPQSYRATLKELLNTVKAKHNIKSEAKWKQVSPVYLPFYKELIDCFFASSEIRFRAVVIESDKVDNIRFNKSDGELGFYKFYYQLLHHWIFDFNEYIIFTDLKVNRDKSRLKDLKLVLERSNLTSEITAVQGLPSEEVVGIQLADLLTGMVNARFNNKTTSAAKLELLRYVEEKHLKRQIGATPKWEEKMNIFRINLQGGW